VSVDAIVEQAPVAKLPEEAEHNDGQDA